MKSALKKELKPIVKNILYFVLITLVISAFIIIAETYNRLSAQSTDECLTCHEDKDLTMEREGKKVSLYVNPDAYKKSVHSIADCEDCHKNYDPDEVPHTKSAQKVNCITCHKDSKKVESSVHGKNNCSDCH